MSRQYPFLVMAAAMLWGTTGTAQALAPTDATPLTIGALRLLVGALALIVLARLQGLPLLGTRLPWRLLLFSGAAIAAYQVSFFIGVERTGVALGTVVGIGSAPIFAGIIGVLILRETLRRAWFFGTGLAIVGGILLMASGGALGVDAIGILFAMGAGLSYAIYAAGSKHLLSDLPPDVVMAWLFGTGALILLPLLLTTSLGWVATAGGLVVVIWLGVMATGLSYALFARGLRGVTASTAVTLSLAEPLTAAVLGIALVGEPLTPGGLVGMALILAGLLVTSGR